MDPDNINELYRKGLIKSPSIMQSPEEIEKSRLVKAVDYIRDIIPRRIRGRIDHLELTITKILHSYY